MSADIIRQLAKNNEGHAKNHKPSISFKDMPNQKAVIVISCMDPRCNPNEFFNFGENGPPVIRNGGGRAKDALRSLHVLSSIMGYGKNTLGAVAVVHHTDCGLINFDDKFIQEKIKDRMSDSPELVSEVDKMDFGSFSNVEASVREDMAIIKADPFLPKDLEIVGYVYDVFSGKTTEID